MPPPSAPVQVRAWLILPGHRDTSAHLELLHYPFWARATRTVTTGALWTLATVTTFLVTLFDPFLSSIPLIVGAATTWRSWRGVFRVCAFEGSCPRCAQPLLLKPGARIRSPHKLVCYNCHHEPELAVR